MMITLLVKALAENMEEIERITENFTGIFAMLMGVMVITIIGTVLVSFRRGWKEEEKPLKLDTKSNTRVWQDKKTGVWHTERVKQDYELEQEEESEDNGEDVEDDE